MKFSGNSVFYISAVIILAIFAYWFFFTGTGNNAPITTAQTTGSTAQTQFQSLLGELQPVSFSTNIFSDPRFTSLINLSTPITPESEGRIDPFASIAGGK